MGQSIRQLQEKTCTDLGLEICQALESDKVGISLTALEGLMPLNGLRHPPTSGLSGWYLWGGTSFSEDADFFKPIHLGHLRVRCELSLKFLLLPPGWRFLTDGAYEDIWFDSALLDIEGR